MLSVQSARRKQNYHTKCGKNCHKIISPCRQPWRCLTFTIIYQIFLSFRLDSWYLVPHSVRKTRPISHLQRRPLSVSLGFSPSTIYSLSGRSSEPSGCLAALWITRVIEIDYARTWTLSRASHSYHPSRLASSAESRRRFVRPVLPKLWRYPSPSSSFLSALGACTCWEDTSVSRYSYLWFSVDTGSRTLGLVSK